MWRAGITKPLAPLVANLLRGWTLETVTSSTTHGVIGGVATNAAGVQLPVTLTPR